MIEAVPGGTLTGLRYWWCYRRADVIYVERYRGMGELERLQGLGIKVRGPYLAATPQEARLKALRKLDRKIKAEVYTNPEAA